MFQPCYYITIDCDECGGESPEIDVGVTEIKTADEYKVNVIEVLVEAEKP